MPVSSLSRSLRLLCLVGALGFASCTESVPTTTGEVMFAPTPEARRDKAVAAAAMQSIDFATAERVAKYKGKVWIDAPAKAKGFDSSQEIGGLFEDAAVKELLEGRDEAAVAEALRERDVRVVALHLDVAPSIDRDGAVLNRLYHHDHLSHFRLFRVSDGLLFYKVQDKPLAFDPKLAAGVAAYLRHRLSGGAPMRFPDTKSDDGSWTLAVTLRGQGEALAVAFAQNATLQGVLEELVADLETAHRRRVEPLDHPPLKDHIADLRIEVHRVIERAWVEPRDTEFLDRFWRMGIDGAYIMTANRKERGFLPGAASYTRAIRDADKFLRETAKQGQMSERRPWRDSSAWLEVMRTIHYLEVPGKGMIYLYRGVPAVPMEAVTVASARQAIVDAGEWYMNNMAEDGSVVYKMWPATNRYSDEYNIVRHALSTWNLVQAWQMDPTRTEFLEGARRTFEFTQQYLVYDTNPETGERMAIYNFNRNQKLGTVVIQLLGLIELARALDTTEFDVQIREMGNFIKFMQEDSGRVEGYYVPDGHPYKGQKNDIIPGEAALALVFLADYFDDDSWMEKLPKYFDYYEPWYEERATRRRTDRPWPWHLYENQDRLDLVQFGPWTVMFANAYHRRTGDERAAKFGLEIARWMVDSYMWDQDRAPFPDMVGGYFKFEGELPAMQAFCYAEGVAAAYQLAMRYKPEDKDYFELHTRETVRFALQMQHNELNTYPFARPDQVFGGIRYAMNEPKVRIDYVHHALSAMYQWVEGAQDDETLPEAVREGPLSPIQALREKRQTALSKARALGDTVAEEKLLPPWGRDKDIWHVPVRVPKPLGPLDQSKPWPEQGKKK